MNDCQSGETHVFPGGETPTPPQVAAWIKWFHQHGVKLSDRRMLIWSGPLNQCGYVRRDIERRRIAWINASTCKEEFFQLESPPLPFPQGVR